MTQPPTPECIVGRGFNGMADLGLPGNWTDTCPRPAVCKAILVFETLPSMDFPLCGEHWGTMHRHGIFEPEAQ